MPVKKPNKVPGVHFRKTKNGEYSVTWIGLNAEPLAHSENLKSVENADVNYMAMINLIFSKKLKVVDETWQKTQIMDVNLLYRCIDFLEERGYGIISPLAVQQSIKATKTTKKRK